MDPPAYPKDLFTPMRSTPDYLLETVLTWEQMARRLDWPQTELDHLKTLLESTHCTSSIYEVTRKAIVVARRSLLRLDGIGRDGMTHVHTVLNVRLWTYRRFPDPISIQLDMPAPSSWCPLHGSGCGHCVLREKKSIMTLELATFDLCRVARTPRPVKPRKTLAPLAKHGKRKSKVLPGQIALPVKP